MKADRLPACHHSGFSPAPPPTLQNAPPSPYQMDQMVGPQPSQDNAPSASGGNPPLGRRRAQYLLVSGCWGGLTGGQELGITDKGCMGLWPEGVTPPSSCATFFLPHHLVQHSSYPFWCRHCNYSAMLGHRYSAVGGGVADPSVPGAVFRVKSGPVSRPKPDRLCVTTTGIPIPRCCTLYRY